jgi:hypothetical protein
LLVAGSDRRNRDLSRRYREIFPIAKSRQVTVV